MSATDLTFDGDLGEVERLGEEIEWFCEENGVSGEVEFDLNLALEELFVNAVKHGGCAGVKEAARVRLELRDGAIHVSFSDRGRAFDPSTAPEPDLDAPLAGRTPGGLGLHLVRHTMRDLQYRRADDWNHITMWRPI